MHVLSSDEEGPSDITPVERFDSKKIRKRLARLNRLKPKLDRASQLRMKKRVKKIIKKLRKEARECSGFTTSSKRLLALHQLVLEHKVTLFIIYSFRDSALGKAHYRKEMGNMTNRSSTN